MSQLVKPAAAAAAAVAPAAVCRVSRQRCRKLTNWKFPVECLLPSAVRADGRRASTFARSFGASFLAARAWNTSASSFVRSLARPFPRSWHLRFVPEYGRLAPLPKLPVNCASYT